jgi:hypothetical protein
MNLLVRKRASVSEPIHNYGEELRRETFGLPEDEVTPVSIRALSPIRGLRLLSREARLGGKLSGHLTRLTVEEHERRAVRAQAFLKRPAVEYPADDALSRNNN